MRKRVALGEKKRENGDCEMALAHLLKSILDLVGFSLCGAYPSLESLASVGAGVPALFPLACMLPESHV